VDKGLLLLRIAGAIPAVIRGQMIPVTLLERIDPPDSRWRRCGDTHCIELDTPTRVHFDTIVVSRIKGPFEYEQLERWRAALPAAAADRDC